MITLFCGVPGSGKTTALAWVVKHALTGRPVKLCGNLITHGQPTIFCNFPIKGTYQLDFSTLGKTDYRDCIIIVDEASMLVDSRDFKNFSKFLLFFFSQHRKSHIDVILATQSYDGVDKKIRDLTVNLYRFNSLPFGIFRADYIQPFFDIVNYKVVSGYEWGNSQFFLGRPVFKFFDTNYQISSPEPLSPPSFHIW